MAVLRQLRLEEGVRTLFADAVCINQNDVFEKTEQVKIMGRIFSLPRRVLFCLKADVENHPLGRVGGVLRRKSGKKQQPLRDGISRILSRCPSELEDIVSEQFFNTHEQGIELSRLSDIQPEI